MPDSGLFPTDAFRRVLNQRHPRGGRRAPAVLPGGRLPAAAPVPQRPTCCAFGIEARPEEILIVNGSQQGFDLIARTLIDPGDFVAIEQPTYPRAMQVFRSFGAQLLAVPWDGEGPRADVLERLLERHTPKLFYCQPSAHNPDRARHRAGDRRAGCSTPPRATRCRSSRTGSTAASTTARARPRRSRRSIATGSSSTSARSRRSCSRACAWAGSSRPPPILERLQAAKQLADLHTSALIQAAVHRFCERRLLDRHVARVAAEYGRRRDRCSWRRCARRMPEGSHVDGAPAAGFSLLLTLPAGLDAATLLPAAIERGVAFTPGASVLRRRRRRADAAAVVLLGAGAAASTRASAAWPTTIKAARDRRPPRRPAGRRSSDSGAAEWPSDESWRPKPEDPSQRRHSRTELNGAAASPIASTSAWPRCSRAASSWTSPTPSRPRSPRTRAPRR